MSARAAASALVLDVGNSRLKWATLELPYRRGQPFVRQGVIELSALRRPAVLARILRSAGDRVLVRACNVAGPLAERRIRTAARLAGTAAPHFERSVAAANGVRNGYQEAWRLGVDRWVALIGAHYEYPRTALCLVAVGTALTIDLLDAAGRHHGGSIAPGPRLMVESLLTHTAGIRRRAGGRRALEGVTRRASTAPFGGDTLSGLVVGAQLACAALIDRTLQMARAHLGERVRLLVGGGAAEVVSPLLKARCQRSDDLVLRGLAVLASARIT